MNEIQDAQTSLAEITKRRNQVIDGAARGRHRGWDAAGMAALVAGFAAMDLPGPPALSLILLVVGTVVAVKCFTRAGQRGRVSLHRSQLTGRFWAVLGGLAAITGGLAYLGMWLLDQSDVPLSNTLLGVLLVAFLVAVEPAYRALLRRGPA